jgi:hypothetical protein
MANFFISYSRKDAAIANKFRDHIYKLDSGHEVFLDIKSLGVGANWKIELQRKVRSCDYFIFIHSKHSLKSAYVKDELEWVSEDELKTGLRKLIVYRLGYAPIIPEIAAYQILDATDNFTIDFFKLMQGIFSGNSFYNVEYELMLEDEFWYKGKLWIDAPKKFLSKIQLVEYRFDYGWDDKNRIRTVKAGAKAIENKFGISFTTKIHFTLFVMIYLWNTKELPFVKKIYLSY